jgi:hypothetical protein
MDLHPQQASEREDVAGDEIFSNVIGLKRAPRCNRAAGLARVFDERLDQDVEVTRGPVGDVREHRDPPDHDIGHAFSVE